MCERFFARKWKTYLTAFDSNCDISRSGNVRAHATLCEVLRTYPKYLRQTRHQAIRGITWRDSYWREIASGLITADMTDPDSLA